MPGFLYDAEPQELVPICKLHEKPASYTAVNISKLHIIVRRTDIKKRPGKGPFLSRDVRYAFLFVRNHIRAQDVLQKRIRTFDYLADPIPARSPICSLHPPATCTSKSSPARVTAAVIGKPSTSRRNSVTLAISQAVIAFSVSSASSCTLIPSISAPLAMTSREQPAANFLSLNFFMTLLTSMPS